MLLGGLVKPRHVGVVIAVARDLRTSIHQSVDSAFVISRMNRRTYVQRHRVDASEIRELLQGAAFPKHKLSYEHVSE